MREDTNASEEGDDDDADDEEDESSIPHGDGQLGIPVQSPV